MTRLPTRLPSIVAVLVFVAACSGDETVLSPGTASSTTASSTTETPTSTLAKNPMSDATVETAAPETTTTPPATSTTSPATTGPPITITDTGRTPMEITVPGTYDDHDLVVRLAFSSEIADVTTGEFESLALAILNGPSGWNRSGFTFVADAASDLRVVLAEGRRVDELCLPLETSGTVSCQNGSVVALNADRWRRGARDWDSTVAAYRVYLVNHEVGHLIGLRHPLERCPTTARVSAVMEPQTNNLGDCTGNGIPLTWEIDWARNRPVVVGPAPDWEGSRPEWPTR